jgi:hypothetical protein
MLYNLNAAERIVWEREKFSAGPECGEAWADHIIQVARLESQYIEGTLTRAQFHREVRKLDKEFRPFEDRIRAIAMADPEAWRKRQESTWSTAWMTPELKRAAGVA